MIIRTQTSHVTTMEPHIRFSSGLLYDGISSSKEPHSIPSGCVFAPFAKLPPNTPQLLIGSSREDLAQLRCRCGAFVSAFSECGFSKVSHQETWSCIVCGESSPMNKDLINHPLRIARSCILHSPPPPTPVAEGFSLVVVLDGNLSRVHLDGVASSVRLALDAAITAGHDKLWFTMIVFTGVVTVYRCGIGGIASGDSYSDVASFNQAAEHVRLLC